MKKLILFIVIALCTAAAFGQVIERKNKLIDNVTERYQTLIGKDKQTKEGFYHAFYKKTLIASGYYKDDKKIGTWHFFWPDGRIMQHYNYDAMRLQFEAPEDSVSRARYVIDKVIRDTDVVTRPARIGGRYFGYIPYFKLFKLPDDIGDINTDKCVVVLELLVSPLGRLADMSVHIKFDQGGSLQDITSYTANIDLLRDEDKMFIPATYNKEPVSSRIALFCYLDRLGNIDIYRQQAQ